MSAKSSPLGSLRRRLISPGIVATLGLPLGALAMTSVVRELNAPRYPVEGRVLIEGRPARGVELALHQHMNVKVPGVSNAPSSIAGVAS